MIRVYKQVQKMDLRGNSSSLNSIFFQCRFAKFIFLYFTPFSINEMEYLLVNLV